MPTGYTAPIYEGEENFTFKKFAMRCARNFGALIEMRGEPLDAEIDFDKCFQPSDYYKKALERVEKEYQEFLDNPPTAEELGKKYDEKVNNDLKRYHERIEKGNALQVRYDAMLEQVKAWEPPTEEHNNLKEFMISQLQKSMDYDCIVYSPYTDDREEYIKYHMSPDPLLKEIAYYKESYEKEVELCNNRKQWVMQLMESLKEE